jgi:hypothetical protein
MADIPQLLSNYDALVGVALGAGLTYGLGALNRRHQEARENETRWYNARFQAYVDLLRAVGQNEVLWVTRAPAFSRNVRFIRGRSRGWQGDGWGRGRAGGGRLRG